MKLEEYLGQLLNAKCKMKLEGRRQIVLKEIPNILLYNFIFHDASINAIFFLNWLFSLSLLYIYYISRTASSCQLGLLKPNRIRLLTIKYQPI